MQVRKHLALAAIGTLTVIGGAFIGPGAATADPWDPDLYGEVNDAVPSDGPTGDYVCVGTTGVMACFKSYGDTWYVRDTAADGRMAIAEWKSYRSRSDSEPIDRLGECHNHLGAGTWGECPKNYAESHFITFRAQSWNRTTNVHSSSEYRYLVSAAG